MCSFWFIYIVKAIFLKYCLIFPVDDEKDKRLTPEQAQLLIEKGIYFNIYKYLKILCHFKIIWNNNSFNSK